MKRSTLLFATVCFMACGAQLVDCIALNTVGDPLVIVGLDFIWVALLLALIIWSLASVWRHWIQALTGAAVCILCVWQHIQNTKIMW